MQISIVLPAYNEAHQIESSLSRVRRFCETRFDDWEIIVVDDGSNDATASIAEKFPDVRCLRNERNRGKGYSVRRGMLEARCDPVLFTDVDLSAPIEESLSLHGAIGAGADIAIGVREGGGAKTVSRSPLRRLMAFVFRLLVRLVVLRGYRDTQCGFKMFRRPVARELFAMQQAEGWAFDLEILLLAGRRGHTVVEVPVEWHESETTTLTWRAPFAMVWEILKIRWRLWRRRERLPAGVAGKGEE